MSGQPIWEAELAVAEPLIPLGELVVAVNRIFHDVEAQHYDARHPEVHQQLPPLWREMISEAGRRLTGQPWRVLDFGCGTGFEAAEVLAAAPTFSGGPIERLACVDLSPAMIEVCRRNLAGHAAASAATMEWSTSVHELAALPGGFNVLLTNSLLHHLPCATSLLEQVEPLLSPQAVWLAGHEPSRRYYANRACLALLADYRRWQKSPSARWRRLWDGRAWRRRVARAAQRRVSPRQETARLAVDHGLFRRLPTPHVIDRLVDFRVAHDASEAKAGRGLDADELATEVGSRWRPVWRRSYAYLGPYYEGSAPPAFQRQAASLAERFPDDGANFCAVWQRAATL